VRAFLQWIEALGDLDDEVVQFLAFACERTPCAVVEMFIRRVERQERDGYQADFRPIPWNGSHDIFSSLAASDQQRPVLCKIRDYSLHKDPLALDSLAGLYRDASLGYGPAG